MEKETILVSACLLGVHCRYDGKCQQIEEFQKILPQLMERYHLVPVCPEVYGGLTTPRDPAEIKDGRVVTNQGEDVNELFEKGAEEVLQLAKLYGCRLAILKQRSPSCGHGTIYDGSFQHNLIKGNGKTAELLQKHGIKVFGEDELEAMLQL